MKITTPLPTLEVFQLFDIPEKFFNERCNSLYFDKLCDKLIDVESIDPVDAFALPHLHDKTHMLLNYFIQGTLHYSSRYNGDSGRKAVLNGILAILYIYWDYQFDNDNLGIESGLTEIKKYKNEAIKSYLPPDEKYVYDWLKQKTDIDKIIWILENLKRPYNGIDQNNDDLDTLTVKLLRDGINYGPLYCLSFYPKPMREIHVYSIIMTLVTYYSMTSIEEVKYCFNRYFRNNSLRPEPDEFTKKLISQYDSTKDGDGVLNSETLGFMTNYLSNHNGEIELIKTKHPLPVNSQMNIY